jgi:hypothetical protein
VNVDCWEIAARNPARENARPPPGDHILWSGFAKGNFPLGWRIENHRIHRKSRRGCKGGAEEILMNLDMAELHRHLFKRLTGSVFEHLCDSLASFAAWRWQSRDLALYGSQ